MPTPPRRPASPTSGAASGPAGPPRRLLALVDGSNFYCACERAFRPDLQHKPVAVLSNNDGCVIARSEEVKAMGVAMGAPFFRVRERLAREGVAVFSSNYELYADLSRRVMEALSTFTPDVEVYSIDEAFLALPTPRAAGRPELREHGRLTELARQIRRRVLRWTGIPVRVAIAETKTLAKVGSAWAKRLRERGEEPAVSLYGLPGPALDSVLASVPVGDVWGIGRAYGRRLPQHGVLTALDLRDLDEAWARRHLRVTGLRTVLELRGLSCIPLEEAPPPRRSLVRSRSFSRPVTSLVELKEAVATHTARACEKLRAEGLAARALSVFFHTGHEGAKGPHRSASLAVELGHPSNRTPELLRVALRLVEEVWKEKDERGRPYPYRKAGVIVLDVTRAEPEQGRLFLPEHADPQAVDALLEAVDRVNGRFGKGAVFFGAEGTSRRDGETETGHQWAMKRQKRSPAYTTRWGDRHVVHAR
ncbi:MAG: Y-family DNA polymerase [Rhodothermales bacterium]|nr:Y-family DNA polymerase [Rhodothermales bacterium]